MVVLGMQFDLGRKSAKISFMGFFVVLLRLTISFEFCASGTNYIECSRNLQKLLIQSIEALYCFTQLKPVAAN